MLLDLFTNQQKLLTMSTLKMYLFLQINMSTNLYYNLLLKRKTQKLDLSKVKIMSMIVNLLIDNQLFKINIEKKPLKDQEMFIIDKMSSDLILIRKIYKLNLHNLNQLLHKMKLLLDLILELKILILFNMISIFQLKIKDQLPHPLKLIMMFLFTTTNTSLLNNKLVFLVVDAKVNCLFPITLIYINMEKEKENILGNKILKTTINGQIQFKNLNKNMERELLTLVY